MHLWLILGLAGQSRVSQFISHPFVGLEWHWCVLFFHPNFPTNFGQWWILFTMLKLKFISNINVTSSCFNSSFLQACSCTVASKIQNSLALHFLLIILPLYLAFLFIFFVSLPLIISVSIHAGIDDIQKVKRKYYNAKIVYRYTKSFTDNPEILSEHALRVPPTSEISLEKYRR